MKIDEALKILPEEKDISKLMLKNGEMLRAFKTIADEYLKQQAEFDLLNQENKQLKGLISLASYEDTGLTPAQVAELGRERLAKILGGAEGDKGKAKAVPLSGGRDWADEGRTVKNCQWLFLWGKAIGYA